MVMKPGNCPDPSHPASQGWIFVVIDTEVATERDCGKQRDVGNGRCRSDEPPLLVELAPGHVVVHQSE